MANFCANNGYSFPAPSVSSPIYSQFNGSNMATTMHQHLVHFTPPSVRTNTSLQVGGPSEPGAKWQQSGTRWANPASGASVTPTTVWQHTVPSSMPWMNSAGVQKNRAYTFHDLPAQSPPSALPTSPRIRESRPPPSCQRRCKRKCETGLDFGGEQPREKVFVNEERMVARLEQLQIDNNNLDWHPNLESETWYTQHRPRPRTFHELDERLTDVQEEDESEASSSESDSSDRLPRLEVSDLLRVGIKTKEILPKVFLDEINKANMQVVLWKPQGHFVKDIIKDITNKNPDSVDMADIEMGSLRPDVADLVPAASPRRDGASTPVPDLLIEAAQMSHSNNAATAASREPDVWHLMTSTPLPDANVDFTFDDDDMDL